MKKRNILLIGILAISIMGSMTSCEDYLDREPTTEIDPEAAYKSFFNFQGFVDEMYMCIPNIMNMEVSTWNWGEEEHYSPNGKNEMVAQVDRGEFASLRKFIYNTGAKPNSNARREKAFWQLGWYAIRKANMGLANLEKLVGTDEEKKLIEGQLYFFRAWFHFSLANYWGGLPYIDTELPSGEKLTLPRESYEDCMLKAIADFERAEQLLPEHWDDTTVGQASIATNQLRANKYMAMCYAGKAYLYLGSPWLKWMKGESVDYSKTVVPSNYNQAYCQKAADKFGQFLKLVEGGQTRYSLLPWEKYHEICWTEGENQRMPGDPEAIFRGPRYDSSAGSVWHQYLIGRFMYSRSWSVYPTANYSNFFGMANGLPIYDTYDVFPAFAKASAESGYNPERPWDNRDPRFYVNIAFDGNRMSSSSSMAGKEFANLYSHDPSDPHTYRSPGYNNTEGLGSTTGLLVVKFNKRPNGTIIHQYDKANQGCWLLSYMRLGDVYLMYAEAVAIAQNSTSKGNGNFDFSALDAVDKIRKRVDGMAVFHEKYRTDLAAFLKELQRERAVELAFEGHRFNDLRRWLLLDREPYTLKTSIEFDRGEKIVHTPHTESATQYKVLNPREEIILKRNFSKKHYWLPIIPSSQTYLYPEFGQNPGW